MRATPLRRRYPRRASCTTPPAATTTPPRTPRRSCGRSTLTTPARWAGATSPTTPWSTSTARYSRAARAGSTNRSRVPHRRLQPQHLGCGDARRLRRRARPRRHPAAHRRPTAGLAARPRPRRPEGHGHAGVGRRFLHQVRGRRRPRRFRRSSPTATSATPTARATPPMPRWTKSATSPRISTTRPGPRSLEDSLAGRRDLRQVGVHRAGSAARSGSPRSPEASADGRRPLRRVRQGRDLLVPDQRSRTDHRRDLRRVGRAGLRARPARPAHQR